MFVFDTSAYSNGRRDHFLPSMLPSVWVLVEAALTDGRIILPREVYREMTRTEDEVAEWIRPHAGIVIEPSQAVQRRAGELVLAFPQPMRRNAADPFILAEAEARDFTVVTYEGRTFSGAPTKRWHRSMPAFV